MTASSTAGAQAARCRVYASAQRTAAALSDPRVCTAAQVDGIYRGLAGRPNPMPAWGSRARGFWRWCGDGRTAFCGAPEAPADRAMRMAWEGKVFFTGRRGGYAYNRVGLDRRGFKVKIRYGPGRLDGRRSIIMDYGAEGDQDPSSAFASHYLWDEARTVQRGLELGYAWWQDRGPGLYRRIAFLLEFTRPDMPITSCPHCYLVDGTIGPPTAG
jgi:hypothetical protein